MNKAVTGDANTARWL